MSELLPWLPTILGLMCVSAFCSASESACFSLSTEQLKAMKDGSSTERIIAHLMATSDKLLIAILFANLIANMSFFAIISVITLEIQKTNATLAGTLSIVALLVMIILCELMPKAVAVLVPRTIAKIAAFPLLGITWVCKPILPMLRLAKDLSLRLFLPNFRPEPLLELSDINRAVTLSRGERSSDPRNKELLRSLVALSDLTAEDIMRPRKMLPIFTPPVTLEDLRDADRTLGKVFIQEDDDEEKYVISHVLHMETLSSVPQSDLNSLEKYAVEVLYVLWNQPAAAIFETLYSKNCNVAVVIDEYGATPGVIFRSDIMERIFARNSERVSQLTDNAPIRRRSENLWNVSGLYTVREFCQYFDLPLPENVENNTIGGVIADQLEHLPKQGDTCEWNGFFFHVITGNDATSIRFRVQKNLKQESKLKEG